MTAPAPSETRDHVAIARRYAEDAIAGRIVAGEFVRLACARQMRDLERAAAGDPSFPYFFDEEAGARACRFIELLRHVKGKWARRDPAHPRGQTIRLEPWQIFKRTTLFGWKRLDTGHRRFRTSYEEVARKNAKSTEAAGIGLYMAFVDDEPGAEVYAAATKKDQAKIVFGDAQTMARRSPEFRLRYGIEVFAHTIVQPSTGSMFKALDAKDSTQDGLNVHCVLNDEVHAQKTRGLYDVLHSAQSARDQPLEVNITTAGSNRAGVCYELRTYAIKVLQGLFDDESFFAIIYTLDKDDDWTDERVWLKANPNLGVSKSLETMRADCRKAMRSSQSQNNFKTKELNLWVNAAIAWMDMAKWEAAADPALRIEDFAGEDCWIGLDLATEIDIASKVRLFQRGDDVYLFASHYLPGAALEKEENAHYAGWAEDGRIVATPGDMIDLDRIERDIFTDADTFRLREVGYDPYQAAHMAIHLQEAGITAVKVPMNVGHISAPMKRLESLVLAGRLHHDGDPVMAWMVSNVVAFLDNKDNIYPRKEQPANKIDGVVAALIALNRLMVYSEADMGKALSEALEQRGMISL